MAETVLVAEQPVGSAEHDVIVVPAPNQPVLVAKAVPATRPAVARPEAEAVTPALRTAGLNRREFLTYTWGAALGLLMLETGVATFYFLYPRFRAGEFGGQFFLAKSEVPPRDQGPKPYTAGKFWLVTTAENKPKALYMVCPHLGCLYKWVPANNRFECPCHGSKYTHDGFYIEGPAPRSLDYFLITEASNQLGVDTGKKTFGIPAAESPARAITS